MGKAIGQMVGGRYHCIMVRSFDFILGTTAALWKGVRFTSERHLRYIAGGKKYQEEEEEEEEVSGVTSSSSVLSCLSSDSLQHDDELQRGSLINMPKK